MRSRRPGPVGLLLWALAVMPVMALLLLVSLAVRVRLADGAWPEFNAPDPKTLGIHYTLAVAGFIAAFASVVLTPVGALVGHFTGRKVAPWLR